MTFKIRYAQSFVEGLLEIFCFYGKREVGSMGREGWLWVEWVIYVVGLQFRFGKV